MQVVDRDLPPGEEWDGGNPQKRRSSGHRGGHGRPATTIMGAGDGPPKIEVTIVDNFYPNG
jgi:hypothetical protein